MKFPTWCDCYGALIGRIIMGGIFLMSGIGKALNFDGTVLSLIAEGVPYPLYFAVIALFIDVLGGIGLVVGYKTKLSATFLLLLTSATAFFFHTAAEAQPLYTTDLALIAGLLYIMSYGSGSFAADNNKHKH